MDSKLEPTEKPIPLSEGEIGKEKQTRKPTSVYCSEQQTDESHGTNQTRIKTRRSRFQVPLDGV